MAVDFLLSWFLGLIWFLLVLTLEVTVYYYFVRVLNDCSFVSTIIPRLISVHMGVLRLICWQHLLAKSGVLVWILCLKVADWYQIMVMFCIYHLTWSANWNLYCFLLCNVYCSIKQCVCNQAISFFLNILFLDCELFSFHCFYIEFYCPVFSIYTFMILFSRFTPLQIDMK